MSFAVVRTPSALIGTSLSSQATISAGANISGSISIGTGNANVDALLSCRVTVGGTAPSTPPTVTFSVSQDLTNWFNRDTFVIPIETTNQAYDMEFPVPKEYQGGKVDVANGTGASIQCYASATVFSIDD
jgi:hypothetical protein